MLPRVFSSCGKYWSAKATRRSKVVWNTLSSVPGFGLRDAQNFWTNSARSDALEREAQVFFSESVMIHLTGLSPHFSPAGSLMLAGGLNSWKMVKRDPMLASDASGSAGADAFRASSKAAIAFFEYMLGSRLALGLTFRNAVNSCFARSVLPRLALHTAR